MLPSSPPLYEISVGRCGMNIQQMQFSDSTFRRLSRLAKSVEYYERKRFLLNKDLAHVVALLRVATKSSHSPVQARLTDLSATLTDDSLGFFRTLGIDLSQHAHFATQNTYEGPGLKLAFK